MIPIRTPLHCNPLYRQLYRNPCTAQLYILKDECVPVPKPEYTLLKAVHSEKAALEAEARSLRWAQSGCVGHGVVAYAEGCA